MGCSVAVHADRLLCRVCFTSWSTQGLEKQRPGCGSRGGQGCPVGRFGRIYLGRHPEPGAARCWWFLTPARPLPTANRWRQTVPLQMDLNLDLNSGGGGGFCWALNLGSPRPNFDFRGIGNTALAQLTRILANIRFVSGLAVTSTEIQPNNPKSRNANAGATGIIDPPGNAPHKRADHRTQLPWSLQLSVNEKEPSRTASLPAT